MIKINPVYKKELKIRVRSAKLSFIFLGYNFILAFIAILGLYLSFEWRLRYRPTIDFGSILGIYITLTIIEFGLILFVIPAFTSGAISGERERQTLEILLTTKLQPIQIILGKLYSSISTLLLLVFSSLPILSTVFIVGGIRFQDLLQFIFLIFITSIFIGSIGIFFSTVFKKTIPATVFTYGMVIFLLVGTVVTAFLIFGIVTMDNRYNSSTVRPQMGWLTFLFLINPAFTMASMMTNQFGNISYITEFLELFGNIPNFITKHWFGISVITQLLISAFLLLLAAKILNPLRKKHYRKRKKKKG